MNWRRSRRCDAGHCVEVAWWRSVPPSPGGSAVWLRDSKHPGGHTLRFAAAGWAALLDDLKGDGLHAGSALVAVGWDGFGDERFMHVWQPDRPDAVLAFTTTEWVAFVAGVRAGEFDA